MRLLAVLDIQGNWQTFADVYQREQQLGRAPDAILHTGNLGLWLTELVLALNDASYAKQVVAFLSVLPLLVVADINNMLQIVGGGGSASDSDDMAPMAAALQGHRLSTYDDYVTSPKLERRLPCPVYSVYGPLDHPELVTQLLLGSVVIDHLHLIDHNHVYVLDDPDLGASIKLYGLGGTVKIHSLFDHGPLSLENDLSPVCGKVGELWVTMVQIAQMYARVMGSDTLNNGDDDPELLTINIFMSHAPVVKTPLLEHLAIMTHADFTLSQGLHFRYPVLGNGMSFVDLMGGLAGYIENYRLKFSRLRMILGELWVIVRHDVHRHVDASLLPVIELALSLFDKIPVLIADNVDEIVPLLFTEAADDTTAKHLLKRINDYYFQAYYNLWHFNVCDVVLEDRTHLNVLGFHLDQHQNFVLEHCTAQGFNFRFKGAGGAGGTRGGAGAGPGGPGRGRGGGNQRHRPRRQSKR